MPKELVTAPEAVVTAVLNQALEPCLRQIADEQARSITVAARQWSPAGEGPPTEIVATPSNQQHPPARGTARLRFRLNYGGDRFLFMAEAMWPHITSGVSGAQVEGRVELREGSPVEVVYSGWIATWGKTEEFAKWP